MEQFFNKDTITDFQKSNGKDFAFRSEIFLKDILKHNITKREYYILQLIKNTEYKGIGLNKLRNRSRIRETNIRKGLTNLLLNEKIYLKGFIRKRYIKRERFNIKGMMNTYNQLMNNNFLPEKKKTGYNYYKIFSFNYKLKTEQFVYPLWWSEDK